MWVHVSLCCMCVHVSLWCMWVHVSLWCMWVHVPLWYKWVHVSPKCSCSQGHITQLGWLVIASSGPKLQLEVYVSSRLLCTLSTTQTPQAPKEGNQYKAFTYFTVSIFRSYTLTDFYLFCAKDEINRTLFTAGENNKENANLQEWYISVTFSKKFLFILDHILNNLSP